MKDIQIERLKKIGSYCFSAGLGVAALGKLMIIVCNHLDGTKKIDMDKILTLLQSKGVSEEEPKKNKEIKLVGGI